MLLEGPITSGKTEQTEFMPTVSYGGEEGKNRSEVKAYRNRPTHTTSKICHQIRSGGILTGGQRNIKRRRMGRCKDWGIAVIERRHDLYDL